MMKRKWVFERNQWITENNQRKFVNDNYISVTYGNINEMNGVLGDHFAL